MKSICKTSYLLIGIAMIFSSCVKHEGVYRPGEPEHTTDLVVPEEFDWSSSRAVALSITSPAATVASFFLDEKCTAESQLATFRVPEGKTTFTFDIPDVNNTIYVQYPLEKGGTKTLKQEINTPKVKSGPEGAVDFMFDDQPLWTSDNKGQALIYIPGGNSYGTILFEDTWPETGDYDFNDFVVNYKIEPVWTMFEPKIDIKISLKFRALGGTYPYNFAIQIGKTLSWDADNGGFFRAEDLLGITDIEQSDKAITVEKLEGTAFPAVVVKGLNSLRKDGFYNTITKKDEGVSISFNVRLKADNAGQQFQGLASPPAFDYFLIHETNQREIHLIGFSPSALYKGYDRDFVSEGENVAGSYYYQNKDHLVWGLKVPEVIGWPVEKQDILKVYTKFGDWVNPDKDNFEPDNATPLKWYAEKHVNKDLIIK